MYEIKMNSKNFGLKIFWKIPCVVFGKFGLLIGAETNESVKEVTFINVKFNVACTSQLKCLESS